MIFATLFVALVSVQSPQVRPLACAARFVRSGHKFIVCAHRGDHSFHTENTLAAYEEAARDGADFGETDLRMTKDGVVVLMHDGTVDRTTNGHGAVSSFTFSEIRKLEFKNPADKGALVPTFEELLMTIKGKLSIYMDIKAVHARDVLPLLQKHEMTQDVIAYLYSPLQRDEWRRDAPGIPQVSDLLVMQNPDQIQKAWTSNPFAITDGPWHEYKQEFVAKFHQLGVAVVPDIQGSDENPSKWKPMLDFGVDGLQTDHPKELISYLKSNNIR